MRRFSAIRASGSWLRFNMSNILRDDKKAFFLSLSRGERVRMMMQHAWEIQCSPLRDVALRREKDGEQSGEAGSQTSIS